MRSVVSASEIAFVTRRELTLRSVGCVLTISTIVVLITDHFNLSSLQHYTALVSIGKGLTSLYGHSMSRR